MATNIGARIELAGEKEFRQALKQIDAGLKATASELSLVTAKYSENANSVKALTERKEALQKTIAQQIEKTKMLHKAIEDAMPQYEKLGKETSRLKEELSNAEAELKNLNKQIESGSDANSELQQKHKEQSKVVEDLRKKLAATESQYRDISIKTAEWQRNLNLTEAELINNKKELDNTSEALKQAQKDMEKFGLAEDEVADKSKNIGSIIADFAGKLGINLPSGAEKAIRALDNTKASTLALAGAVAGLVKKFADATIETAKTADEILTLSAQTGLATDTIQKMNYASELLDVSTETITGSMAKMIRTVGQAQKGTGDAAEAFRKLHVNIRDSHGQLKNSEEIFYQVIDALGKVRNETERDALAMKIFGRSAQELNPLIKAGSSALKELGDEAEKMGYVMSEGTLQSFGAVDDAMQRFHNQTQAFKQTIGLALLPVLTAFFEILNKIDPKVIAIAATWGTMAITAFSLIKGITSMAAAWATYTAATTAASAATTTATAASAAFNAVNLKTVAIIVAVVAGLTALAATIAILAGKGQDLNKAMSGVADSISKSASNAVVSVNQISTNTIRYRYVSGSHANGLDYVPYDGYIAELHRGERVLTAEENRRGFGDTYILQVKLDEISDVQKVVKLFKEMRQTNRAGRLVMA
ncbi:MAG: hypothetical protein GXX10_05920 [Clostridiaceae bacterium]|nr:hypothetical protein [Clostridiaceae bacterium]